MNPHAKSDLSRFNLLLSLTLFLVGVFAMVWLIPNQVAVSDPEATGITPRFMPYLAAGLMTLTAALLGISILRSQLTGRGPVAEENEDNNNLGFGRVELVQLAIMTVGVLAYSALLMQLGFLVASAAFLLVSLRVGGMRQWLLILAIAVGVPLVLQEAVWEAFSISLPPFPYFD